MHMQPESCALQSTADWVNDRDEVACGECEEWGSTSTCSSKREITVKLSNNPLHTRNSRQLDFVSNHCCTCWFLLGSLSDYVM